MTYKEQVVAHAIEGLIQGGVRESDAHSMKRLFELIYNAGYDQKGREVAKGMEGINATIDDMKEDTEMLIAALKGKK